MLAALVSAIAILSGAPKSQPSIRVLTVDGYQITIPSSWKNVAPAKCINVNVTGSVYSIGSTTALSQYGSECAANPMNATVLNFGYGGPPLWFIPVGEFKDELIHGMDVQVTHAQLDGSNFILALLPSLNDWVLLEYPTALTKAVAAKITSVISTLTDRNAKRPVHPAESHFIGSWHFQGIYSHLQVISLRVAQMSINHQNGITETDYMTLQSGGVGRLIGTVNRVVLKGGASSAAFYAVGDKFLLELPTSQLLMQWQFGISPRSALGFTSWCGPKTPSSLQAACY